MQKNLYCIASARRNRFAMGALDLSIDQGYESAVLNTDFPNENVRGVAGCIDLAAPVQPLSEDGRSVARLTA